IEILKRLQREAFSDLMKLRDRQDKVERVLSLYKSSKGSPFREASTHIRGEVDILGALLFVDPNDQQNHYAIQRAGIGTGIHSRFTFETTVREKDTLLAEFVASNKGQGDLLGSPLSLAKVLYAANITDWFSVAAVPVGARCKDVGITSSSYQEKSLTNYSFVGPPLLNQHNGSGIGLMVRQSNVVASLAQFVSESGLQPESTDIICCFSTFGQVMCQLSRSMKLSLLGLHKVLKLSNQQFSPGSMSLPVGILKCRKEPETLTGAPSSSVATNREDKIMSGAIALMLEADLDESTRIGGWVEMKYSNPRHLQWAVTMSDTPEDDFGWGLSLGGLVQGPKSWDHFQVEAFLKLNAGKNFGLQPGLVYAMDGTTQFPALMLRSSWSL
ncbi:hypothetical protein RJ639_016741, partial [Escallonia herrerae]